LNLDMATVLARCAALREVLGVRDTELPLVLRKCPDLLLLERTELTARHEHLGHATRFSPALVCPGHRMVLTRPGPNAAH
jgi:hypothetical protein